MEKQRSLPKTIEDVREQMSEYCREIYEAGWAYIRLPEIIKEHDRVLKEQSLYRGAIDYSESDYSPGSGEF